MDREKSGMTHKANIYGKAKWNVQTALAGNAVLLRAAVEYIEITSVT